MSDEGPGDGNADGPGRSRRKLLRDLLTLPLGGGVAGAALASKSQQEEALGPESAEFGQWTATTMTTRLAGDTDYETATAITQNVYTAINEHTRPGAAILVPDHDLGAALPGVAVIHHPVDGAVLLTERDSIPQATRDEIRRLHPEGVHVDGNTQLYIIGGERYISADVEQFVVEEMGLETRRISGETPVEVAANVDQFLSTLHANHRDTVFIADTDETTRAIPAQSWNAHGGDGFLYVDGDSIPDATRDQLDARFDEAYMYLLGNEAAISPLVARNLARYGHVQRIPDASNPYALSAAFAGWKDIGRNQGWVFGEWPRSIGWGIAEAGHNFIFANPENWQIALPACVESHRGKHGPLLFVEAGDVPEPVANYLSKFLEPYDAAPYDRKYNHGWIIGNEENIDHQVQGELHALLEGEGSGQ